MDPLSNLHPFSIVRVISVETKARPPSLTTAAAFVSFPLPASAASHRDSPRNRCHSSPSVSTTLPGSSFESEPRLTSIDLARSYRTPSEGSSTARALVAVGRPPHHHSSTTSLLPHPYSKSRRQGLVWRVWCISLVLHPLTSSADRQHMHHHAVRVHGDHALGRTPPRCLGRH
jgi:hypothetical protein